MVKCSLFLLISPMWLFTVLCVNAESDYFPVVQTETSTEDCDGIVKLFFEQLSSASQSSYLFVSVFRDEMDKYIHFLDEKKKRIQETVTKGIEMKIKIQHISHNLKNFITPLTKELQPELDEIEKHAAAELKKLKGVEDVKDIDETQKQLKDSCTLIECQVKKIYTLSYSINPCNKAAGKTVNKYAVAEVKTELIDFAKTLIAVVFTSKQNVDNINGKMKVASIFFCNIRNDLIKAEQIKNQLLQPHKGHLKTDASSLLCSSLAQFVFSIIFGMIFHILNTDEI